MEKIMEREIKTESIPAATVAQLPPEYAMMKIENETIQALAMAKPRSHKQIRDEIAAQLEAYPSFAASAIYSKPVGKDEKGEMQFACGLSVRAAEAIAEAYGYCRVRTDVIPVDEDHVKVSAAFVDYQKGRIWEDAGIVSKFYKDRFGKIRRHADDRFFNVVVKAELSKRVREVILRSVPPGLRSELQEMAEQRMRRLLGEEGIQKILGAFEKIGISQVQLEQYIGRTIKQGWTEDDRLKLRGLYNAIEAGETSIEEVMESLDEKKAAGNGPVTGKSLTKSPEKKSEDYIPSGGHEVVEEAAGREAAAGPNGTIPPVGEAASGDEKEMSLL